MKNSFFYSISDIKKMKTLLRTGEKIPKIAKNHYQEFGTTEGALIMKLRAVAKHTRGRKPKKTKDVVVKTTIEKAKGLSVPDGTRFEGVSKRVELFQDHFCVYF
jgi:hypothetical protein